MILKTEIEREEDGRWIAEVLDVPGCLAYGQTQDEALAKAKVLALRVMADRREHGEPRVLDLEEDSPKLEAELLQAADGPFTPSSSAEMRAACEKVIREKRG